MSKTSDGRFKVIAPTQIIVKFRRAPFPIAIGTKGKPSPLSPNNEDERKLFLNFLKKHQKTFCF